MSVNTGNISTAATNIVNAATALASAWAAMQVELKAARADAFARGGGSIEGVMRRGAGDPESLEELAGVLVWAGLSDVLAIARGIPGNIAPVSDYQARWTARISNNSLTSP